jgi:hypothetical protein
MININLEGKKNLNALAGVADGTVDGGHDGGLCLAVHDLLIEDSDAHRGQRRHPALHVISMVV